MRIAYVLISSAVIYGDSNGIKSQARTWKVSLEIHGHTVIEINPWGNYDWKSFDLIHIFGTGQWLFPFVNSLKNKNQNIVLSPVIDSLANTNLYRYATLLGNKRLRLWSPPFTLRQTLPLLKGVFVRSNYESNYIFGNIPMERVVKVPLAIGVNEPSAKIEIEKEDFCLHISSLSDQRKNVVRLVQAAKEFGFKLVLAGYKGTEEQYEPIKIAIDNSDNIEVLGYISEEKKLDLYRKAKVFALPSLNEGVGIVALDAAAMGCEIAITKLGGPKEYYNNLAEEVDPKSVESIGKSIMRLLSGEVCYQPNLYEYIWENFSISSIGKSLEQHYLNLIR